MSLRLLILLINPLTSHFRHWNVLWHWVALSLGGSPSMKKEVVTEVETLKKLNEELKKSVQILEEREESSAMFYSLQAKIFFHQASKAERDSWNLQESIATYQKLFHNEPLPENEVTSSPCQIPVDADGGEAE